MRPCGSVFWGASETQVQMLLYADDVTTSKSFKIESTEINTVVVISGLPSTLVPQGWQWHE